MSTTVIHQRQLSILHITCKQTTALRLLYYIHKLLHARVPSNYTIKHWIYWTFDKLNYMSPHKRDWSVQSFLMKWKTHICTDSEKCSHSAAFAETMFCCKKEKIITNSKAASNLALEKNYKQFHNCILQQKTGDFTQI